MKRLVSEFVPFVWWVVMGALAWTTIWPATGAVIVTLAAPTLLHVVAVKAPQLPDTATSALSPAS